MDIRIIIQLHEFFLSRFSGNAKNIAQRLNVSERTVYHYIKFMKEELNAPIVFDNYNNSYGYEGECKLRFKGCKINN